MYKLLLILKYLRKRRLAWWSVLAVALCTTMVLVVMSVMGGWIAMFQESFHGLSGDILIRSMRFQMPYYEQIIQRMKAEMPELKDAAPVVRAYCVLKIGVAEGKPGDGVRIETGLEVLGYPPNIANVNEFTESLHKLKGAKQLTFPLWPNVVYFKPPGYRAELDVRSWPGMIVGQGVIGVRRDKNGEIHRPNEMYNGYVFLTVAPHELGGAAMDFSNTKSAQFWIIDDSRTKVSIVDDKRVYVPFDTLQSLLMMQGTADEPARASEIQVAFKSGADLNKAKATIERIISEVRQTQAKETAIRKLRQQAKEAAEKQAEDQKLNPEQTQKLITQRVQAAESDQLMVLRQSMDEYGSLQKHFPYEVKTWSEAYLTYLSAIENEKGLIVILFALISLVAVFLIFCIFYMVVAEKTRDIGTIKSVGATPAGVAAIFIGYGGVIGVIGGFLGLLFSYLIVHNINELHGWLASHGWVIWNPEVYLFDTIPNRMNPHETMIVVAVAIVASIVGATVPAFRAAQMHPVEALRWE